MGLQYRVKKVNLDLYKRKVRGYKVQFLSQGIITEDDLVAYILNSAQIPQSMVRACTMAIADAIQFYVINGHRVSFGKFGKFHLKVENTCVDTPEECLADTVKRTTLCFTPSADIKNLLGKAQLRKYESLSDK
ncbi:MAG: hypothetical protein IJP82_09175 [Bacteroidaceae bacterium]|nr:hypothetical protein [Bacteroidaceae bacterium]